jgi:diguanylate cyclase (GGDEF)-like protein
VAQAAASVVLRKSFLLTAISDCICLLLLLLAGFAFARNAFGSHRRQRLVWILLGSGYAVEAFGQILWMRWEFVWKQIPTMYFGDACIFLAWTALIMGFALRPHVEPTQQNRRLGTLDLLLLLLAGLYLYLFLVIPWQYLSPDPLAYNLAYKFLALAQDTALLAIVVLGLRQSFGKWRQFYILLTAVIAFDTVMEYVTDTSGTAYFSGSWYDTVSAVGLSGMAFAALFLPLLAAWSFLDRGLPSAVWNFRILLSLGATVLIAFIGIVKHARLEKELAHANQELLDASVTDLLTGVRNRRFFSNSIQADVQQALRSVTSLAATETRNCDLVFYLIDIDHFKRVNDLFGHQIGDLVLVEVARRISSAARLSDAVIRWGGEEFLLMSRYTDRKEAGVLARRVLDAVGAKPCHIEGIADEINVTCSVGWAAFPWIESDPASISHDQVLVLADYALYQAKGAGRNRAVGVLPPGSAAHGEAETSPIVINGIPTFPVTTLGPGSEQASAAAAAK